MSEDIKVPEGITLERDSKGVNGMMRHPSMAAPPYGEIDEETKRMSLEIWFNDAWYAIEGTEELYIKLPLSKIMK